MHKNESFINTRIKSITFAFKGAIYLIRTEASIQVQFVIAILVTGLGLYFNISKIEWFVQILAIGLVLSIEY